MEINLVPLLSSLLETTPVLPDTLHLLSYRSCHRKDKHLSHFSQAKGALLLTRCLLAHFQTEQMIAGSLPSPHPQDLKVITYAQLPPSTSSSTVKKDLNKTWHFLEKQERPASKKMLMPCPNKQSIWWLNGIITPDGCAHSYG